jgi:hypothetical protein
MAVAWIISPASGETAFTQITLASGFYPDWLELALLEKAPFAAIIMS